MHDLRLLLEQLQCGREWTRWSAPHASPRQVRTRDHCDACVHTSELTSRWRRREKPGKSVAVGHCLPSGVALKRAAHMKYSGGRESDRRRPVQRAACAPRMRDAGVCTKCAEVRAISRACTTDNRVPDAQTVAASAKRRRPCVRRLHPAHPEAQRGRAGSRQV